MKPIEVETDSESRHIDRRVDFTRAC